MIIKNLINATFSTVGTNFDSYVKRFLKKYNANIDITFINLNKNKYEIYQDKKMVDYFTSEATFRQFFNCLITLGFIKESIGKYSILKIEIDWIYITNKIFEKSEKLSINILRQSRIISLLAITNLIDKENINVYKIRGKRGLSSLDNIKKEASMWEKENNNNSNMFHNTLGRILKYEFEKYRI